MEAKMNVSQIVEETRAKMKEGKNAPSFQEVLYVLDRDYEDLERDIFGSSAVDCLSVNPETPSAIPQGNLFIKNAVQISSVLKKYKGIYSLD
jgi:hypothetical protein